MMQILPYHQINTQKYAALLTQCQAPIYAQLWYLNAVCNQIKILIFENYEAVFILPEKTKYGIKYLMQPDFCQQLGLFGDPKYLVKSLDYIQKKYIYAVLQIHNQPELPTKSILKITQRNNYILHTTQRNYTQNHRRNLQKSIKNQVEIHQNIDETDCIKFFETHKGNTLRHTAAHYNTLHTLLAAARRHDGLLCFGAYHNQKLIAIAAFVHTPTTATLILFAASAQGKASGAAFALIHHVIDNYNFKKIDFEGSDIPSIARFYQGFGAECVPYHKLILKKCTLF